jgi:uracil-DNA glycosylase
MYPPKAWQPILKHAIETQSFESLCAFLDEEDRKGFRVFPNPSDRFSALERVPPDAVRVVILGQDPYHGEGQAIGLSFAVPNHLSPKPPSLKNILKELESDLGTAIPPQLSDLTGWANQGVLLLNTLLSVRASEPLSHQGRGWEEFTDSILKAINEREDPVIFVLWGAHAQKKKNLIDLNRHRVLESAHPSPLSAYRGFFGSKIFSRINEHLRFLGKPEIDWSRISLNESLNFLEIKDS